MQRIIAIVICFWVFQTSGQTNITSAEYFIDTDPGFGSATVISITPSQNISNQVLNVAIGSVSPGLHVLCIRSRDASGKWSLTNSKIFYKVAANVITNITKVEYFFDLDPGFGNATSIPVTPSADINNSTFNAGISLLTQGLHILFLRSKAAAGTWSVTNSIAFYKSANSVITNIIKAEYFFDSDPGFGNATNISITPAANLSDVTINASTSSLPQGLHILFMRSKDSTGNWSITNSKTFYKGANNSIVNITNAEYFYDTDPGFGNGTAISITNSVNVIDKTFNVGIGSLGQGFHMLFVRSKDANGRWSISNPKPFYINGNINSSANINYVEYFFDTDPGFGNAINIPITTSSDLQNINLNASTSSLGKGIHFLYLRSRNTNGVWSITNEIIFYRTGSSSVDNIVAMEYFIDNNDLGFGKAIPLAMIPSANMQDFIGTVNISGLSIGNHNLFFRSRTDSGWSVTNAVAFPIAGVSGTPYINVNAITKTLMCAKDSLKVSYDAVGTFNPGNIFNVELSDNSGVFSATPFIIGTYTGTNSTIINCKLPAHLTNGTNYRVRTSSTNPLVTGGTGSDLITIHDRPVAQTIIGASDANAGFSYPYSVPVVSGSNWLWTAPAAIISQTANASNLFWNTPGLPQTINVTETNQYGCIGDVSVKTVNVYALKIINTTPSTFTPCSGSSLTVSASAYGVYYAGNTFTAQISNNTGNFSSPIVIGVYSPPAQPLGNAQPIVVNSVIPSNIVNGNNYRIRIVASNYAVTGDTSAALSIISPVASFSVNNISQCFDLNLFQFTNNSVITSGTLNYQWSFGDNTASSNVVNPNHSYTSSGTFIVKLVVTSNIGCKDSMSVNVTVLPKPAASFLINNYSQCVNSNSYILTNTSSISSGTITYAWNFGDLGTSSSTNPTHVYSSSGTYTIKLVVTSNNGCKDSISQIVTVYPKPSPSFTINNSSQCHGGNNFSFINTSIIQSGTMTYKWDFGDNTTSTNVNPSHTFLSVGNYQVKLVVTSNSGCMDSVSHSVSVNNCGTYTFIGNGDWLTASNWSNNLMPPTTIPNNMNVTITPIVNGQCYYIGTITLQAGGIITVSSGKAFNVRVQ